MGRVDGTIRLTDTVAYTGLVVGKTYTVTGILVNKDTGMWIIGSDGDPISASTEFTAERSSGFVDVEFEVNSAVLEGTTIVAFETVTYLDQPVAIHADIEDEGQTVHFPSITTTATVGGSKTFLPADSITLTDTITYSNLVPGRTYELQGRLMTSVGVEFAPNGTPAVSVFRFIPETADGSVDVTFVFYGKDLKNGDKLVVFEKLYLIEENVDANGNVTERSILITAHEDLTDDYQTVTVTKPSIPSTGEKSSASFVIGIVCVIIGGVVAVIYLKKRKDQ